MSWVLSYFITCGWFCQSGHQAVILPSEEICLKQMEIIQKRVKDDGDILYLHCAKIEKEETSPE